jgi:hypothetical protein
MPNACFVKQPILLRELPIVAGTPATGISVWLFEGARELHRENSEKKPESFLIKKTVL